jgi:hypothetical protein
VKKQLFWGVSALYIQNFIRSTFIIIIIIILLLSFVPLSGVGLQQPNPECLCVLRQPSLFLKILSFFFHQRPLMFFPFYPKLSSSTRHLSSCFSYFSSRPAATHP